MLLAPLDSLRDVSDVARYFGCLVSDIERLAGNTDQTKHYLRMDIPKKGRRRQGQFRTVYKAEETLNQIQRVIHKVICEQATFPECVQAFLPDASIRKNAAIHVGQSRLLHVDIEDFFDAISTSQVTDAFRSLGCRDAIAELLARLATLNGRLPQGSSASPMIANLVCRDLDKHLEELAGHERRYTRYADDITISGTDLPDSASVVAVLSTYGFRVREGSLRVQRRGRAQYVTGLSIFAPTGPHVPRRLKRRLRLILHYVERFGISDHARTPCPRPGSSSSSQRRR